jgi:hypothetical protein
MERAMNRHSKHRADAHPGALLTDSDFAAIVKRYEDAGDVQNADIIRRQWEVARASNTQRDKLLTIIAAAYQVAGVHDAPAHILDVLADPENASDAQVDAMLPYAPISVVQASADAHPKPAETRMVTWSAASASQVHARPEDARIAVRTWRERIGVGPDFPLHAPTDVERAMEAEIAELRALMPDSMRYRWLAAGWTREELAADEAAGRQPADKPQLTVINQIALWYFAKDEIDALIDAAMAINDDRTRDE